MPSVPFGGSGVVLLPPSPVDSMAGRQHKLNPPCASSESGTGGIQIGRGGSRILAQAKEGRGSPEDDNHRHRSSLEIIISKGYKKRAIAALCFRYRMPHR